MLHGILFHLMEHTHTHTITLTSWGKKVISNWIVERYVCALLMSVEYVHCAHDDKSKTQKPSNWLPRNVTLSITGDNRKNQFRNEKSSRFLWYLLVVSQYLHTTSFISAFTAYVQRHQHHCHYTSPSMCSTVTKHRTCQSVSIQYIN